MNFKRLKIISIICCVIGFILGLYALIEGIKSIGGEGWASFGTLYIIPSIIALIIIILDFLIAIDVLKKGLVYSFISSLIKIVIIVAFLPDTFSSIQDEIASGVSNLDFDLIIIGFFIIVLIPSIINIKKLLYIRKNS